MAIEFDHITAIHDNPITTYGHGDAIEIENPTTGQARASANIANNTTSINNLTNGKNYQATVDLAAVQAAIGEKWKAASMFTIVFGSDGKVLYKKEGLIEKAGAFPMDALGDATPSPDLLAFRRSILANMTDTAGYPGNKAYWMEDYAKVASK